MLEVVETPLTSQECLGVGDSLADVCTQLKLVHGFCDRCAERLTILCISYTKAHRTACDRGGLADGAGGCGGCSRVLGRMNVSG